MPVEIRELVIRAVVEPRPDGEEAAPPVPPDKARLVQLCVAEVLRILKRDRER